MKTILEFINKNTVYIKEFKQDYGLMWIDDIRDPKDDRWQSFIHKAFPMAFNSHHIENIIWVKSYKECVEWIDENGLPDYICFDHDLGDISDPDNEKTGYDCAKFICDYCMNNNKKFPKYAIQSDNGPGAENIDKYIQNYKKHCE